MTHARRRLTRLLILMLNRPRLRRDRGHRRYGRHRGLRLRRLLRLRFGWRVSLTPLLAQYWQRCDPARRKPRWLRWHQRLRRQGEPRPLRLAPLHMDVHAGNIIHNESGLRLIDWEYAGDGDIALELAAVWITPGERRRLVEAYARRAAIDAQLLWRQVVLWRPWVLLLMAGWYEMRWRQSGDRQFITLADETWCQLDNERKG